VSTCSFHATKLFHTGEGGALFCQDKETRQEMWYRHNFGHDGPDKYHGLGINAKMSELQAAMGLSVLPYMEHILTERQRVCDYYDQQLEFSKISKLKIREHTQWNYCYYPVIFKTEEELLETMKRLAAEDIYPRRYFYPSLEALPYIESNSCPIAEDIAKRIMCLPLYTTLKFKELKLVCNLLNSK
jgi:dTDP-4-amino-4,6-dideoxygalactose transaminase